MLAVLVAAGSLTAQDTMIVRSYRTIDVCSSERRWLIAPYVGAVIPKDSLASFDISIGYDTSKIRPTDVLTEGTLALQFQTFAAQMNLVIPGEMRIFGGDAVRFAVGDKPLVAIAGEFIGSCTEVDSLSITWPASFNGEFKKRITIYQLEPITARAIPKSRPDLGTNFKKDSIVIEKSENVGNVQAILLLKELTSQSCRLRFSIDDTTIASIDSARLQGSGQATMKRLGAGEIEISFVQQTGTEPVIELAIRSRTNVGRTKTLLHSQLFLENECECNRPLIRDTTLIVCDNPMVSVNETSIDEQTVNLQVSDELVKCQCDHGQTNEIKVFSMSGELIGSTGQLMTNETFLNIAGLLHGAYIIVGSCGSKQLIKMKLK